MVNWEQLKSEATSAMKKAYAPYSKFPVGVAALVDDGRVISGCNVENASYGLTLCAECSLISELIMSGGGRLIAAVCVDKNGNLLSPCGRCRQLLYEHGGDQLELLTPDGPKNMTVILPWGFGPKDFKLMSEPFAAVEVIAAKRDRNELTDPQIDWIIDAYVRGIVADEQMSALLMAILLNGMNSREISRWTDAMINSGERMSWNSLGKPTVDKHSTGGVGDKITLPLAPLVAACGAAVPQLSGRGLGHTGGTLDKMEAIPGWRASLSNEEMLKVLQDCGAVICAAGTGLAPADKKLYALRDVTATVQAIPLIASSIMSKKIAEGTSALILDVKTGNGAFMSEPEKAKELAQTMVDLGKRAGVTTRALVTAMDVPLGLTAGNALEVRESVEVLQGGGPSDVVELTILLAKEMLDAAKVNGKDPETALRDGSAMDHWRRMVSAQGGDPDAPLPVAKENEIITAQSDGIVSSMNALQVGISAWRLGAGRERQGEKVQAGAGIEIHAKPGDAVKKGDPLFTLHTDEPARFERAKDALINAVTIGNSVSDHLPLVVAKID